mmetsp:Transcript_38788/g.34479  ORF Transcript_38788/g.34479 Transcript_38788/m.34479 type:complete len:202 (+) Transcript_38788:1076-1681(+)
MYANKKIKGLANYEYNAMEKSSHSSFTGDNDGDDEGDEDDNIIPKKEEMENPNNTSVKIEETTKEGTSSPNSQNNNINNMLYLSLFNNANNQANFNSLNPLSFQSHNQKNLTNDDDDDFKDDEDDYNDYVKKENIPMTLDPRRNGKDSPSYKRDSLVLSPLYMNGLNQSLFSSYPLRNFASTPMNAEDDFLKPSPSHAMSL